VFGIGLNYRDHAAESGLPVPAGEPPVFTKFPSCITGPHGDIELPPGGHVDWEVELVAVIGRHARHVPAGRGLEYVAGYAVGQDVSERVLQLAATPPQFSMGKSLPGFGPVGPWLVTLDELADPGDLALGCEINGEPVQSSRTSQLIFGVPALVANLSASVLLLPGDIIFTGTPAGVGLGRNPQRWLAGGDVLTSHIEGIGEMRHRFVAAPPPSRRYASPSLVLSHIFVSVR
jgi:2-keto-4-pentenoate hydratase/2-oxohepta-3-ene-1,7-dioic acid hydratase in catechol pathway